MNKIKQVLRNINQKYRDYFAEKIYITTKYIRIATMIAWLLP